MSAVSDMLSISQAAELIGKSERTVYRYIRQKRLDCQRLNVNDREIVKIPKEDLKRFFDSDIDRMSEEFMTDVRRDKKFVKKNDKKSVKIHSDALLSKEDIKTILEDVMGNRETQLMKPIEQQALFVAGKLTQENKDLRERMEIVLQENNALMEQLKILPAPAETILDDLKQKEGSLKAKDEELENLRMSLQEERTVREKLEAELQEARKPWWKKMFGVK